MDETGKSPHEIADEFRALGKNLIMTMQKFWESAERQKLTGEIEKGIEDFSNTFQKEFQKLKASPTGQQMKEDIEDLRERFESGEAQELAKREFIQVLRKINQELENATSRWEKER